MHILPVVATKATWVPQCIYLICFMTNVIPLSRPLRKVYEVSDEGICTVCGLRE